MGFGGYHPYPRRFGGGRPRLRIVHEALAAGRGSALDALNSETIAYVETHAHARAITFDGYGTNDRLALQWDPLRCDPVMLERWEKILRIVPSPTATIYDRRQKVCARWRRFLDASALHSRLITRLAAEVGEAFTAVEYIDITNAVIHVPDATYPWGTVASGAPWTSTVAHILVLLTKPSGYSEGQFYDAAAKVAPAVDGMIPAWCTIDWYRAPSGGPAISVSGGPSQAGFYLDDEHNLDNNVFDV